MALSVASASPPLKYAFFLFFLLNCCFVSTLILFLEVPSVPLIMNLLLTLVFALFTLFYKLFHNKFQNWFLSVCFLCNFLVSILFSVVSFTTKSENSSISVSSESVLGLIALGAFSIVLLSQSALVLWFASLSLLFLVRSALQSKPKSAPTGKANKKTAISKESCVQLFSQWIRRCFSKKKLPISASAKKKEPPKKVVTPKKPENSKSTNFFENIKPKSNRLIKPKTNLQSENSFYDSKISNLPQQPNSLFSNRAQSTKPAQDPSEFAESFRPNDLHENAEVIQMDVSDFDDSNEANAIPQIKKSHAGFGRAPAPKDPRQSVDTTVNQSMAEQERKAMDLPDSKRKSSTFKKEWRDYENNDLSIFDSFVNYEN